MNADSFINSSDDKFYRRFWILSLLAGVEEAGCSPIDLRGFNVLSYLANAVSECYEIPTLSATILKEREGPLYPKLIWDLDRLVGMGLVRVSNIVISEERKVSHASYSITQSGLNCEKRCRLLNESIASVGDSLRSTALAYSRNLIKVTTDSIKALDGNYANPQYSEGQVIDFGDWSKINFTANSVQLILNQLRLGEITDSSIGVSLYSAYLASFEDSRVSHE